MIESSSLGANQLPFDNEYWKLIYKNKFDIDGIYNKKEHADYISSFLKLLEIKINSILDVGFGNGELLEEIVSKLSPKKIIGIDPSREMIHNILRKKWIRKFHSSFLHSEFTNFNFNLLQDKIFDLCIFNSVLQYIPNSKVATCLENIATHCKYCYFSVPTKNDYSVMKKQFMFLDPYAYQRSKKFYLTNILKHFRIIGFNFLESKKLITESNFISELFC